MVEPLYTLRNFIISEKKSIESDDILILGIPFDSTETTLPGQRIAPFSIRMNALSIELSDEISIYDAGDVCVVHGSFQKTAERIKSVLADLKPKKAIFLGGEHTITLPLLEYFKTEVDVLFWFDAHPDYYDKYNENKFCHATVLKRIREVFNGEIFLLGVRCEKECVDEGVKIIESVEDVENEIKNKRIYVSLDLDVLDPSIMPSVSDPVPCGLGYQELMKNLKIIFEKGSVKYCDIVELNPMLGMRISDKTAAHIFVELLKLLYF